MSKPAKTRWTILALVVFATLSLLPGPCTAADAWPSRTVHFIVTLGPGSGVDIGARLVADKLSARWGQPVVVENRPGGDGMVAITTQRTITRCSSRR
jgi:tripartite-type tricarboxylate transporter receptor subunit TctC